MKWFASITLLVLVQFANANNGNEMGNGGDGVLCGNNLEFYDLYEMRIKNRFKLDTSTLANGNSVEDIFEQTMIKLDLINPRRAEKYRTWFNDFNSETLFTDDEIQDVPESSVIAIPQGCELVQIAAQEKPIFPGDLRYTVNNTYWSMLDNFNKVALIIHELIIRETKDQNENLQHGNTRLNRYLNSFIHSEEIYSISLKDYVDLLILTRMQYADTQHGFSFRLDMPFVFRNSNLVSSAKIIEGQYINYKYQNQSLLLKAEVKVYETQGYILSESNFVEYLKPKDLHSIKVEYYGDIYTFERLHEDRYSQPFIVNTKCVTDGGPCTGNSIHIEWWGAGNYGMKVFKNGYKFNECRYLRFDLDRENIKCN